MRRTSRRWYLAGFGVVLLAAIGFAGIGRYWRQTPLPPEIDLSHVHPRVASAIRSQLGRVAQDPRSGEEWGRLGRLLMAHHLRGDALACLAQAAALQPAEFRWVYYQGYLREETELERAVGLYRKARELRPDYVPLRLRLAHCLTRLGHAEQAWRELEQAEVVQPDNPYVQMLLGQLAVARNDLSAGRLHLQRAAAAPGWYPRPAYVELARVEHRLGHAEAARRAEQAARALPATAAIDFPDPILAEAEESGVLARRFAQQADALMAAGDFARAADAYRSLVEHRPDMPRPLTNLASALAMQRRLNESIQTYRLAIERFPDDSNAYLGLAKALQEAGDVAGSIDAYEQYLAIKPDDGRALYNLALLLQKQKLLDLAREAFARSVEADPQYAPAQLALGALLFERGDAEAAIPYIRAAVRLAPDDPVPREHLERALELRADSHVRQD